jgi:hypothetical protein
MSTSRGGGAQASSVSAAAAATAPAVATDVTTAADAADHFIKYFPLSSGASVTSSASSAASEEEEDYETLLTAGTLLAHFESIISGMILENSLSKSAVVKLLTVVPAVAAAVADNVPVNAVPYKPWSQQRRN